MVVSVQLLGGKAGLLWAVMVTSALNESWPDDITLGARHLECGLPIPCVIRTAKIASLEVHRASKLGELPPDLLSAVQDKMRAHLGF